MEIHLPLSVSLSHRNYLQDNATVQYALRLVSKHIVECQISAGAFCID